MEMVNKDIATRIATAEYPWFLKIIAYHRGVKVEDFEPRYSKDVWVAKRSDEIMQIGATKEELNLINN